MRGFLPLVILFSFFNSNAQNWQPISSVGYRLFDAGDDRLKAVRVDSVKINNGDSIFYFNKEIGYCTISNPNDNPPIEDPQYLNLNGNSFLGSKCIIEKNDKTVFINFEKDSLLIKSLSSLNDSWNFYKKKKDSIIAKVIKIEIDSVLGKTDSVKTIALKCSPGIKSESTINSLQIKIGKETGLIECTNFNFIPGIDSLYEHRNYRGHNYWFMSPPIDALKKHQIKGISSLERGTKNITIEDIYSFSVGDEFHYLIEEDGPQTTYYTEKIKNTITSMIDLGDSIAIEYDYISQLTMYENGYIDPSSQELKSNTIKHTIPKESNYNELSNIPYLIATGAPDSKINYDIYINYQYRNQSKSSIINLSNSYFATDSLCLPTNISLSSRPYKNDFICTLNNNSFIGLHRYNDAFHKIDLVYSKNCNGEKGEPFGDLVGIEKPSNTEIVISPNPSNGIFKININQQATCSIFDNTGQALQTLLLINGSNSVNLSKFANGTYFLQIESNKAVTTKKILIKK